MIYGLRLSRPLFHAGILACIFRGAYWLRQQTDLLPGIQLAIPTIHVGDLVIFSTLSIMIFVIVNSTT